MMPILLMLFHQSSSAQEIVIPLYEEKAPGSEKWDWKEVQTEKSLWSSSVVYNVVSPTLTVYKPLGNKNTGAGIILAPGGGFFQLSIQ